MQFSHILTAEYQGFDEFPSPESRLGLVQMQVCGKLHNLRFRQKRCAQRAAESRKHSSEDLFEDGPFSELSRKKNILAGALGREITSQSAVVPSGPQRPSGFPPNTRMLYINLMIYIFLTICPSPIYHASSQRCFMNRVAHTPLITQ